MSKHNPLSPQQVWTDCHHSTQGGYYRLKSHRLGLHWAWCYSDTMSSWLGGAEWPENSAGCWSAWPRASNSLGWLWSLGCSHPSRRAESALPAQSMALTPQTPHQKLCSGKFGSCLKWAHSVPPRPENWVIAHILQSITQPHLTERAVRTPGTCCITQQRSSQEAGRQSWTPLKQSQRPCSARQG